MALVYPPARFSELGFFMERFFSVGHGAAQPFPNLLEKIFQQLFDLRNSSL
jgi:hypothetical protein